MRFLIEDAGDGWWDCPSPLRAVVLDGPASMLESREGARFPETYWLVRTEPAIEWNGDARYAERWGPDHPLCRPMPPTHHALVMASSPWNGAVDPERGLGIPVYPVAGSPDSVSEAVPNAELGIKADLRRDPAGG